MNNYFRLTACLLLLLSAETQAAKEAPVMNVRVEVQMVSVPLAKALELLPNLHDSGSIDGAFSQIQKMIAGGEANLLAWPEVTTKSGQRAVTEDIEEVRYPTEYNPLEVTSAAAPNPQPDTKGKADLVDHSLVVPQSFETRNVGATLEVEPTVSPDSQSIDLNLVPQYVRLLAFKRFSSGKDARGNEPTVEQPQFYTTKTTTSLTVRNGQRVLIASFHLREPADHLLFFILKAEALPVAEAPKTKKP